MNINVARWSSHTAYRLNYPTYPGVYPKVETETCSDGVYSVLRTCNYATCDIGSARSIILEIRIQCSIVRDRKK